MSQRQKSAPKTAQERLEQGKLTDDDLRVLARLLGRPDLARGAEVVENANHWAESLLASGRTAQSGSNSSLDD